MKRHLLLFTIIIAAGFLSPLLSQQLKHPVAVAIVIDSVTYTNTRNAVDAYRNMLYNKERLSVYLVSGNWNKPEDVQVKLRELANAKSPVLEGAILIGNIPVAMIRNAQHMTTAFKMDEIKYPFEKSSVPSDRFYDDFSLKFRFLKQDDKRPELFYYELTEQSPQTVNSNIYTSRIKSHKKGEAQYAEISAFLNKAVAARNGDNSFKRLLSFTGSGYNSESLTSWQDEKAALNELFPQAFRTSTLNSVLRYDMSSRIKKELLSELQKPSTSVAFMTHHGDPSIEYLSNMPVANDMESARDILQYNLRVALRQSIKRGKNAEEAINELMKKYNVSAEAFTGSDNDSLSKADSLVHADTRIVPQDIASLTTEPRVIILNACYNASFHLPDNIASAYIFNKGNTLVAHGNTTNVLQDKWTLEQLGLLSKGVRIGNWARLVNTLESHLEGDPTIHFSNSDLNEDIVLKGSDKKTWEKYQKSDDVIAQCLALKMIYNIQGKESASLLEKTFYQSPSGNVRMQCLALLGRVGDNAYRKVLKDALNDNYELIRRKAADWIAKDGSDDLISPLVNTALSRPYDTRVLFAVDKALGLMDWDMVRTEIKKQADNAAFIYDKDETISELISQVDNDEKKAKAYLAIVQNRMADSAKRNTAIRSFRNGTYHVFVPDLIKIAGDKEESGDVRINILEALGWFSTSYQKEKILNLCRGIIADSKENTEVRNEAYQTQERLQNWTLY